MIAQAVSEQSVKRTPSFSDGVRFRHFNDGNGFRPEKHKKGKKERRRAYTGCAAGVIYSLTLYHRNNNFISPIPPLALCRKT